MSFFKIGQKVKITDGGKEYVGEIRESFDDGLYRIYVRGLPSQFYGADVLSLARGRPRKYDKDLAA